MIFFSLPGSKSVSVTFCVTLSGVPRSLSTVSRALPFRRSFCVSGSSRPSYWSSTHPFTPFATFSPVSWMSVFWPYPLPRFRSFWWWTSYITPRTEGRLEFSPHFSPCSTPAYLFDSCLTTRRKTRSTSSSLGYRTWCPSKIEVLWSTVQTRNPNSKILNTITSLRLILI